MAFCCAGFFAPVAQSAEPRLVKPDASGRVVLRAGDAVIKGGNEAGPKLENKYGRENIGFWTNTASLEFRIEPPTSGTYRLELEYGCASGAGGSEIEVWVGPALAVFTVKDTGRGWESLAIANLGAVDIESREPLLVRIKPVRKGSSGIMNFYELRLVPPKR
jgi:hypothetical protein